MLKPQSTAARSVISACSSVVQNHVKISYQNVDRKDNLINATLDTIVDTQVAIRQERTEQHSPAKEKLSTYFWANHVF